MNFKIDHENKNNYEECSICLDSLEFKDVAILNCTHSFHYECIGKWMESIIKNKIDTKDSFCPLCNNGDEISNIICRDKVDPKDFNNTKKKIIKPLKLIKKKIYKFYKSITK